MTNETGASWREASGAAAAKLARATAEKRVLVNILRLLMEMLMKLVCYWVELMDWIVVMICCDEVMTLRPATVLLIYNFCFPPAPSGGNFSRCCLWIMDMRSSKALVLLATPTRYELQPRI